MLDRREFLAGAATFGAMTLLPACGPDEGAAPADGTLEHPWTATDPNPQADESKLAVPLLYGANVDATRVRLWVEVGDVSVSPPAPHPQQQDHYVSELYLRDQFGNEIAAFSYPYEAQARLIASVELPERVTRVVAIAKCSTSGYWKTEVDASALKVPPQGDIQRAYTLAQPGAMADIAAKHSPILGKRPDGSFAVEVGDRAAGKLHEMTEQHYIKAIVVFDENHQIRASQTLTPQVAEPVLEDVPVAGAKKVRVLAWCNLHFYWEAEFNVV